MVLNSAIDAIPVVVAYGGTGAATLTGVLTGNGTSAVTANAVTQHGVLIAGASNAVSSLAVAATGTVLAGSTGADPAFTATPSGLTSITATSFITSDATNGVTYSANNITGTGSGTNINLNLVPKGTGSIIFSQSSAANNINYQATNSDNTSGSSTAGFQAAVGGATAGDPYVQYAVSGVTTWTTGIDNSVSDNFVIAASNALGTSNAASWTTAGALTNTAGITATTGNVTSTAGNVVCSAAGQGVRVNPSTNTPGATPQVLNAIHGQVGFTDTIANGAAGTLTMTNSSITASSIIIATASCATANSALVISTITPGSGTVAFALWNAGSASTGGTTIFINFWVMN